jgi:hypothetical protein
LRPLALQIACRIVRLSYARRRIASLFSHTRPRLSLRLARQIMYSSDCSSYCEPFFLPLLMAFPAASSTDYSSDCSSLLYSSTAFLAARSTEYSSDCASLLHLLTASAAAHSSAYLSDCVSLIPIDGFPSDSLVGLLVRLLVVLRVSFLTPVDGFPGGSLVCLLGGLHLTFLTPGDVFPGGSLVG